MPASPAILTGVSCNTEWIPLRASRKGTKIHRLVSYETYDHVQTAIRREKQLKGWRREKKNALIEKANRRRQDLGANWGREMRFRGQPLQKTP
jgi:hypothetical protein